jgi:hypothetical protein
MMKIDAIERYVDQVLEINGFCKGDKELLRQLLHRLYTAATMFHLMTDEQRALIGRIQTELSAFFVTKIVLKERKRKGRKRKIPPTPPIKVKEGQVKEQKTNIYAKRKNSSSLDERKMAFLLECEQYNEKYGKQIVDDFYCHWSEENEEDGKMLFEYERTWNTAKRLHKWSNNPISSAIKIAKIRLEKVKQSKQKQTIEKEQAAAERDDANEQLFHQIAENKKKAVSYEEYLAKKNENEK